MTIQTYAIEINENTYPIVLACIPSVAAVVPFSTIDGQLLIINKLTITSVKGKPHINVTNEIMSKESCIKLYSFGTPLEQHFAFTTLVRK